MLSDVLRCFNQTSLIDWNGLLIILPSSQLNLKTLMALQTTRTFLIENYSPFFEKNQKFHLLSDFWGVKWLYFFLVKINRIILTYSKLNKKKIFLRESWQPNRMTVKLRLRKAFFIVLGVVKILLFLLSQPFTNWASIKTL